MTAEPVSIDDARRQRQGQGGTGRISPNNVQAEESLLGAMLLDPRAIATAVESGLDAADFYKSAHGLIFEAVIGLFGQGQPADPVTVSEELRRAEALEKAGGPAVLITLQAGTPSIGNAGRYARIVAEHSLLRRLIAAGESIRSLGYDLPSDVQGAVDAAEQMVYELRPRAELPSAHSLRDVLGDWLDVIEAKVEAGGRIEHPMGWLELDDRLGGLHPGRLIVVAGRPGTGKSSMAGVMATRVAARGEPVVIFSLEMSREELAGRFVSEATGIVGSDLERGDVAPRDWERISSVMASLGSLPIDLIDATPITLLAVRAGIRRAVQRYGSVGLVIVDHIGLMSGRGRAENRQVEVAELARGLKLLSKEMVVPVVALAQLNRNLESRMDKRPTLADLRETGELENSADQVVFVYRDELYHSKTEDAGIAELIVAKNRHGAPGTVKVVADLATGRWNDLTRREES
jgi:replicative DNA helicase